MPAEWLFVYGTLMSRGANHDLLRPYVQEIRKAVMEGILYHLSAGYPMASPGPGVIRGEALYLLTDREVWRKLDRYEGFRGREARDNLYIRRRVSVWLEPDREKVMAWTYMVPPNRQDWLAKHGTRIESGCWRNDFKR